MKNVSYIFIPFTFDRRDNFRPLIDALDVSRMWKQADDEIKYMLKYVADKIDVHDRKNCQCFHYTLKESARVEFGLATQTDWYTIVSEIEQEEAIRFQILSIELYCFSTTVCIAAYKICLERSEPMWVSSAQYELKKASRTKIRLDGDDSKPFTLLDAAKKITAELSVASSLSFFYYVDIDRARANILTYLEVEPQKDYKRELFYLRRCYNEKGFLYIEDEEQDSKEIFAASPDTVWGISSEAAVCLACLEYGRKEFIEKTFFKNFNEQYLFMYVLLLHQKYALYMFLMKIGVGIYNSLEMLEEYRNDLYEFETDFVFSCITEVPQYQNLYERMTGAFSLKQIYEDVHEPLKSLSEVRREASENSQKKRDGRVNDALLWLSILSFFSALMDGFGFVEEFFGSFLSGIWIHIIQGGCVVMVVAVVTNIFVNLIKNRKDD